MADCRNCKHAVWGYMDYYPNALIRYVSDCELGEDEESCESFEEAEGEA